MLLPVHRLFLTLMLAGTGRPAPENEGLQSHRVGAYPVVGAGMLPPVEAGVEANDSPGFGIVVHGVAKRQSFGQPVCVNMNRRVPGRDQRPSAGP